MCGFVSIFNIQEQTPELRQQALRMSQKIRHRGPDWSGIYCGGSAILAHERLSIVDPESGRQPLFSPDKKQVLAVNGEIYNHQNIRARFAGKYQYQTGSDCEVVLSLYREMRQDSDFANLIYTDEDAIHARICKMIEQLNGIFAFALYDAERDEYYVSLEEIVKPGDDAIFKEYELNFGGKIKLKVSEKLRRLRRETNLQYDMTCWVHSHPGLGVFFSNADSSVQMQLKHPTHPKFLVAIVIDILTPNQELGIFTFKHDMSINSKADLQKMYSLEEFYQWAVKSDRTSFKQEDHRNIMQAASTRIDSHYGVELSNGAIIDMCQLQTVQGNGLLAWVHGYTCENNGKTEFVLKTVSQNKVVQDDELIGCYINGAHCSIPTIKRLISNDFSNIKFILFYSTADDTLTAIPVIDGQLSVNEDSYGEEKLEDLKIWTRRKR